MRRILLISTILSVGLSEVLVPEIRAQDVWTPNHTSKEKPFPVNWERISIPDKHQESPANWEVVPEVDEENQSSSVVIWEVLRSDDMPLIAPSKKESDSRFIPPGNLEEAEALLDTIPLNSGDFKPLLNLSHAVPTASVLNREEWRFLSSTISPFKYAEGTGNQNYIIKLDYGLNDTFQISGFYSEANDPLNTQITGLDIRPGNLWEVYGAEARWKFFSNDRFSLALNGSLESWTVGSGGGDSRNQSSGDNNSPNIFNNSAERVQTQNFIGSISLPLTWHANKEWQFTFNPGISFLPPSQGEGQGGAGEFYGTNPYMSGGLMWHPIPEVGVTASIAQPIGGGTNSFDRDLKYSKVPIFSGGINLHLNPRVALQGQLTNGFGATPATSLLTLPSDNRLGYSANFVYTADAADTPQPPLDAQQQSLSLGGLTVNTALVPPDNTILIKASADEKGNLNTTLGFSISNIFHLDFCKGEHNRVPQTNIYARAFANDDSGNWRGSGKAVLTSPLRGSPIWSAFRISFGRTADKFANTTNGYLFAETPLTWEANSKLAFNISPKVAWSGVGTLWGIGIGANIQIAPRWQLIPETNFVLNSPEETNSTLGIRWNVYDDIAIEIYGSTASSIVDIGQILNADQIRWGGRLTIKL